MGDKTPFAVGTDRLEVVRWADFQKHAMKESGTESGSRSMKNDSFAEVYSTYELVQPPRDLTTLTSLIEINTWHMRAVKTRAADTVGLGWGLRAKKESASEVDKERAEQFLKSRSFVNFKPEGLDRMLRMVQQDLISNGNGALEFVYEDYLEDNELDSLNYIPSHTIRAHKDMNKYCQIRANKKVWYKKPGYMYDVDYRDGTEHPLGSLEAAYRASILLFINEPTFRSSYYGLPDIIPALGAIYSMISIRNYNNSFFENHGVPEYAIYITGDYDLGDVDPDSGEYQIITTIKDHLALLAANPHSPLILALPSQSPEGKVDIEFKPLSVEVKDGSFSITNKDDRDEILSAHGIPLYRLGIVETGSLGGSTAEESTDIYKQSVIAPDKNRMETIVNLMVLIQGLKIEGWDFYLEEIDTSDEDQELKVGEFLWTKGGITPNELRVIFGGRFNLEAVEGVLGMDYHYVNNVPLESGPVMQDEVIEAVKDFHGELLGMARKERHDRLI